MSSSDIAVRVMEAAAVQVQEWWCRRLAAAPFPMHVMSVEDFVRLDRSMLLLLPRQPVSAVS